MFEKLAIIATLLTIIGFFAVGPSDLVKGVKDWFIQPLIKIKNKKDALSILELFEMLKVDDIRIENYFVSTSLGDEKFDSEIIEYTGKLPYEIAQIKVAEISERLEEAKRYGITLDNNASFALRRIDVSRPEGANGKRENIYKLILEPTDYFSFLFPNLSLDKKFYCNETQENHTLRDLLSLDRDRLGVSTFSDFPFCQFKVGTGTLAVTTDNHLICSVRSNRQFVAGKQKQDELAVHISAAEGMYRSRNNPLSSDCLDNGKISPFATSKRSLIDEINLTEKHFENNKIKCLGYFTDLKRAQPFFLFYFKLKCSKEEFYSIYSNTSTDIHENEAVFTLPINFHSIRKLFDGVPFNDLDASYPSMYNDFFTANGATKIRIASNHAKVGFASIAFKDAGAITKGMFT